MQLFHYLPAVAPAVIFCILYFLITIPITVLTYRTKTKFMYLVVGTGIAEGIGYACRLALMNSWSLNTYIIMTMMILLSPNALALVNYVALGKVIAIQSTMKDNPVMNEKRFRLPLLTDSNGGIIGSRVAKFFFASDILSFFLQGAGGGMMAQATLESMESGEKVMMIGLFIQLFFFAVYSILTVRVYRIHKQTKAIQSTTVLNDGSTYELGLLDKVFYSLFITIILLTIRNLYRFIEFAQGFDGYLATTEAYFYIFDASLIFGCFIIYTIFHFGLFLPPVVSVSRTTMKNDKVFIQVNPIPVGMDIEANIPSPAYGTYNKH